MFQEEELELSSEDEGENAQEKMRWRSALVKDLTSTDRVHLTRRHSVSLCHAPTPAPAHHSPPPPQGSKEKEASAPILATLDLNLEEVAHIRSVLTRAELEALPLDSAIKELVEAGRLCFLCLTTRFGLFSRGVRCAVCHQTVCSKCSVRMRIPSEQWRAVPVEVLSPALSDPPSPPSSLPPLGNCAGSAPSSPKPPPRQVLSPSVGPLVPPPVTSKYSYGDGVTRGRRRWSMVSWGGTGGRERLEGSMLGVCGDCKSMVLEVIRAQGRSRRSRRGRRREECGL